MNIKVFEGSPPDLQNHKEYNFFASWEVTGRCSKNQRFQMVSKHAGAGHLQKLMVLKHFVENLWIHTFLEKVSDFQELEELSKIS